MKTKTTYFRLFDKQTGRYLRTGYNSTSIKRLRTDFVEYKSIDFEDKDDEQFFIDMSDDELIEFIKTDGFEIEESETKFEKVN